MRGGSAMASLSRTRVIERLANVAGSGSHDTELVRRYRDTGDPEAFEGIVRKHGRTVLGVCGRILIDPHAAEDAFQATFLQLVRKARTLHSPAALAAWLCATARRTALRHRRPGPRSRGAERPTLARGPLDSLTARELLTGIEDEIARLPEQYRLPLVLCYLDGLSKRQAADQLGLSVGAFGGRLERGRDKLRAALARRGLAPMVALGLLVPLAGPASADLIRRTAGICVRGGPTPAAVALLAAGRAGVLKKAGFAVGLLVLGGLGWIAATGRAEPPGPQAKVETPRPAPDARQDLYGDALPPDALARLGAIRWRHRDQSGRNIDVVPSPTGQLVATVNRMNFEAEAVRVWALPDGRPVCELPWEDPIAGWGVQFIPDGSQLMVLAPRGVVKFYDPRTGKRLAESKPVVEEDDIVQSIGGNVGGWSQHRLVCDGRWVVTTEEGGTPTPEGRPPTLTEVTTDPAARPRQVKLERPVGEFSFMRAAHYISGGNSLLKVSYNKASGWKPQIHRWDVRTGRLVGHVLLPTNNMAVAWSRDGKRVATWRHDVPPTDELRVWDTETGTEVVPLEGASRKDHFAMQFSPDGNRLIAQVGRTKTTTTVAVWELGRGKEVGRLTVPEWCNEFDLLPDGKTVLAADPLGMLFGAWDIATGRRLSPVTGHESAVQNLAFTPDGTTLLTASADPDEKVTAWDAATGQRLRELAAPGGYSYNLTRWSNPFVRTPGGAVVTTGNGTLVWTDGTTGRELRRVTPGPITAALDRRDSFQTEWLSLTHDPRTGRPAVLGLHAFGPSPDRSEEGDYRWKEVVTLWDAESGELLSHRTDSRGAYHPDEVVLSPDGRWLARTSHSDRSVELRPAFGGRGSVKLPYPAGEYSQHSLFTPDGQTLITVSKKRPPNNAAGGSAEPDTVRLWEVPTGTAPLEFTAPLTGRRRGQGRQT